MYIRKRFFFLVLACAVTMQAQEDFDFDLLGIGDEYLRTGCSFADQIVPPLNECGVVNILKEDLFCKTHQLNQRSLLDIPTFFTPPLPHDYFLLRAHLFWNNTPRMYFSKNSSDLDAYMTFNSDCLLSKITQAQHTITTDPDCSAFFIGSLGINPEVFDVDVKKITSLFSKITIEERRAGVMAEIAQQIDALLLSIKIPFYYLERNIFLTDAEIARIQELSFVPQTSEGTDMEFACRHFISDKFGFGDARVTLAIKAHQDDNLLVHMGLFTTAPTALTLQKGIIGSHFKKNCAPPPFDLCEILNLGLSATALEDRLKHDMGILLENAIDNLSALLLEQDLGNGKHWGIGAVLEPTWFMHNYWKLYNRFSVEIFTPVTEQRFFVKSADLKEFAKRNFNESIDMEVAESNLRFLNARLLDMFFPRAFDVTIIPAPILMGTQMIMYQGHHFTAMVGQDLWWQGAETMRTNDDCFGKYNIKKTEGISAFQYKLLASLGYTAPFSDGDWYLSLNGDKTISSSGIGKDYTISLNCSLYW